MTVELTKAETRRLYVILNTFIKLKVPGAKTHDKTAHKISANLEAQIRKDRKSENK